MTRPTKFRVRRSDTLEWHYFELGDLIRGKAKIDPLKEESNWSWRDWCEFTGLTDKNGKEIYEGDIITENIQNNFGSYTPDMAVAVYFNQKSASFRVETPSDPIHDWSIGQNCVVVGNIHQNPELLK